VAEVDFWNVGESKNNLYRDMPLPQSSIQLYRPFCKM